MSQSEPIGIAGATSPLSAHFEFGENWANFLSTLDGQRVTAATQSIQTLLKMESLANQRFLDAGSGSGLFSLAANRLGADVVSFDIDPNSIACTRSLKERFFPQKEEWTICEGSLTDRGFLKSLGEFNIVYCWGVAHHTGDMWNCIDNLLPLVKPGGSIVLAIYNDQLHISKQWYKIKLVYQKLPRIIRPLYVVAIGAIPILKRLAVTILACCFRLLTLRNPFVPILIWTRETCSLEAGSRGMHAWYDLVDWVGGWPFEVAKPEEIFRFMRDRGFSLRELTTSGGHGCNEFVFIRTEACPETT